jgi:hypothetical protein
LVKIFIGMYNIASLYVEYAKGFTALGHEVFAVDFQVYSPIIDHSHTNMQVYSLLEQKMAEEGSDSRKRRQFWLNYYSAYAWEKALEADVCLFMYQTFKPDCSDLEILRRRGKKIAVRFIGSETLIPEIDAQYNGLRGRMRGGYDLSAPLDEGRKKLFYARGAEKHAHLILGTSPLSLRPGLWDFFNLSLDDIPFKPCQNKIPLLLHGPSLHASKGTALWQQIFADLKLQGLNFTVNYVQNMDHREFLRQYAAADINCGGLYVGGKAELEAMAGGAIPLAASFPWPPPGYNSVGSYISRLTDITCRALQADAEQIKAIRDVKRSFCETQARYFRLVQHVTPNSAAEVLRYWIGNYEERRPRAEEGRRFVEEVCAPVKLCARILRILQDPESVESHALLHDFSDQFFRRRYIPRPDPEWRAAVNAATATVKDCLWYKQYVEAGTRDGLFF